MNKKEREEKEQRLASLVKYMEELYGDVKHLGKLMEVLVQIAKNCKSNAAKEFLIKVFNLGVCDFGKSANEEIWAEMVEIMEEAKGIAIELELPPDTYSWVDVFKEADKIDWNQHFGFSSKEDG